MKRCHTLSAVCLIVLLAACGAPTAIFTPTFAPTPTTETTPVPLLLTPIQTPLPLPALPPLTNSQSSKALALHNDLLLTANQDSGSVTLVNTVSHSVLKEIAVGDDPRSVAITPDGKRALVTLRGDNAIAVVHLDDRRLETTYPIGHMPFGVVTDGRKIYVSCFADDQVVVLDLQSGDVLYRVNVPDAPAGLALSGQWLLATHFYSGQVSLLNVQRTPFLVGTVNAEPDGNLTGRIVIAPDGRRAYMPQIRTGLALISLQYMQDWFPVVSVLDIPTMTGSRDARLTLSAVDHAANMPSDVAFTEGGSTMYVTLAGSDAVAVIDVQTRESRSRIPVGTNPVGIVTDGENAFVLNALDGTISIINTANNSVTDTIPVTQTPLSPELLRGKILFHRATAPASSDGSISCATCHFDGGADARTWINFRSGPRNTPALGGTAMFPPYNWAGDMDELQDTIEDQIRNVMFGDGLIEGAFDPTLHQTDAGRSADLDALVAYVASLEPWSSPYLQPDGSLTESAQRGMSLFLSGSPDCSCHSPPLYTDQRKHNLAGAGFSLEEYEAFDTPSLRGLWATAPYMHDGVVQTLEELLTRTDPVHSVAGNLTEQQLDDLIAFLLSL